MCTCKCVSSSICVQVYACVYTCRFCACIRTCSCLHVCSYAGRVFAQRIIRVPMDIHAPLSAHAAEFVSGHPFV